MILVVLAVVGVSYYAVVVASYGPELLEGGGKAAGALLIILTFHALVGNPPSLTALLFFERYHMEGFRSRDESRNCFWFRGKIF
jgi:hypothetical protein